MWVEDIPLGNMTRQPITADPRVPGSIRSLPAAAKMMLAIVATADLQVVDCTVESIRRNLQRRATQAAVHYGLMILTPSGQ